MKIKKLDARGFSHDLFLVLFVVIFAIAGVAYLIASHADSCDASTSGATSGVTSGTTSGATSGVTSGTTCPVSTATSAPSSSPTSAPATTPGSVLIEGESMSGSRDNVNLPDATASGKFNRPMWHSGDLSKTFNSTGALKSVTVRAKATTCSGSPQMIVTVDGAIVSQSTVTSRGWTNTLAPITNNNATSHTVTVTFPNDRYVAGRCDRNLYIDKLTFTQQT